MGQVAAAARWEKWRVNRKQEQLRLQWQGNDLANTCQMALESVTDGCSLRGQWGVRSDQRQQKCLLQN